MRGRRMFCLTRQFADGTAENKGSGLFDFRAWYFEGRKATGLQPILPGMFASYLVDGSGHERHLAQLQGGARPVFREDSGAQFLAFDGTNDFLFASGQGITFKEITLFIVASPHSNQG